MNGKLYLSDHLVPFSYCSRKRDMLLLSLEKECNPEKIGWSEVQERTSTPKPSGRPSAEI